MPRASSQVIGLADLQAELDRLGPKLHEVVAEAVEDTAKEVLAQARRDVPVDTGLTRDGLDIAYRDDGLTADVGEGDDSRAHIAGFLEFGTSAMPARPFMTPAAEAQRAPMRQRIEANVRKALQ